MHAYISAGISAQKRRSEHILQKMSSRLNDACTVAQLTECCKQRGIPWSNANGILSKARLLENIRFDIKKLPSVRILRKESGVQRMRHVGSHRMNLPQEMLHLLRHAPRPLSPKHRQLDVLDFMTTTGEVSKAARRLRRCFRTRRSLNADTFGIERNACEDVLTRKGLKIAWKKLKHIRSGGLFVVQPPCKRWLCYVSRSHSKRRFDDDFPSGRALRGTGNTNDKETRIANITAQRVASLVWWALDHNIKVILEQPKGSLLQKYTPYRCVLSRMKRWKVDGCRYGWKSQKPFWIYLSDGLQGDALKRCNHTGRHALQLMTDGQGDNQAMSDSGHYTRKFADALLRTWC